MKPGQLLEESLVLRRADDRRHAAAMVALALARRVNQQDDIRVGFIGSQRNAAGMGRVGHHGFNRDAVEFRHHRPGRLIRVDGLHLAQKAGRFDARAGGSGAGIGPRA